MHWSYCSLAPSHQNVSCILCADHEFSTYIISHHPKSDLLKKHLEKTRIHLFPGISIWIFSQIAKILGATSIRYRSDTSMSDRYLIDTDLRIFAVWADILLTHWGRVTHICARKLTNIGSDNGLSPGRRQAIIWTNAGILLIGTLGTNFSEFLFVIHTFSFNKMHLKMLSAKWRPFCLGLNVLIQTPGVFHQQIPMFACYKVIWFIV